MKFSNQMSLTKHAEEGGFDGTGVHGNHVGGWMHDF